MFDPALGGLSILVHAPAMPAATPARLRTVAELVQFAGDRVAMTDILTCLVGRGVRALLRRRRRPGRPALRRPRRRRPLPDPGPPRSRGAHAPTRADGPGFAPDEVPDPTLASTERVGDELYLRYEFNRG
jgi:hypothetical protein